MVNDDDIKKHYYAQKDFLFFVTEVLGYKEDKSLGFHNLTETHLELCKFIQDSGTSKLVLMPRYSFKSGLVTVGYSLWQLVKNPNTRILIYSDSATKAQGFLQGIKNHVEGTAPNSKFRDMYPSWETSPQWGKWNESEIILSSRTQQFIEPSVDTGGIESSKVGKHYDLIIFDDIVSDLNVTTKAQMDKVHDCYKKALSLLKPNGEVLITGTRWSYGDCYGRIISENKEKKNFKVFVKDALETKDGKLIFESIGLTREFLDYQRLEQGSYIFSSIYRNSPVDDETALFRQENFKFYRPRDKFHERMFITCACDPAGEGEDYTAITVVGTNTHKEMHILDCVNMHLKPNQIIDQIIRLNYKWGFDKFAIEGNFFRGTLEENLKDVIKEHQKNPFFKPFSTQEIIASVKNRNFNRVLALQPFHERKAILFPNSVSDDINTLSGAFSELAFQMLQFTIDGSKSPHDDLIISLAYHTEIVRPGGMAQGVEPDYSSAVAFENRFFETMNSSRTPLRYRPKIQRSFS